MSATSTRHSRKAPITSDAATAKHWKLFRWQVAFGRKLGRACETNFFFFCGTGPLFEPPRALGKTGVVLIQNCLRKFCAMLTLRFQEWQITLLRKLYTTKTRVDLTQDTAKNIRAVAQHHAVEVAQGTYFTASDGSALAGKAHRRKDHRIREDTPRIFHPEVLWPGVERWQPCVWKRFAWKT